jgi:hypothetical protein
VIAASKALIKVEATSALQGFAALITILFKFHGD